MKMKIQNFWYYYKAVVIIAALIVTAGAYLVLQQTKTEKADYEVAIVSRSYFTEEQLFDLRGKLEAFGADSNLDGSVVVNLRTFRIALGEDGQDSAQISALDADLVGNVSGLFLLDDPVGFEKATNGICRSSEAVPVSECKALNSSSFSGFFLAVRGDADEKYAAMLEALTASS